MRGYEFYLEGLSVHRAAEKLRLSEVNVLSARMVGKNVVAVEVEANSRKKAFAILHSSCYTIKKVRPTGLLRIREMCMRSVGLFIGAAIALSMLAVMQSRVLRIDVEGSGSYLSAQVKEILSEEGISLLTPMPRESALASARILGLPRVHFCAIKGRGGVLTVQVEVSDETSPLASVPLRAPATGVIEELVVLRGTPLFSVGDSVKQGEEIVGGYTILGEEVKGSIVIARVRVCFPVSKEYDTSEEEAPLQAMLDFGEITDIHIRKTAGGWLVEGTGHAEGELNFG